MSSPDKLPFSQFVKIDRENAEPIYLQVAYQVIQAIQRQLIPVGFKLPGSRTLSAELGVHRQTIVAATDELQTQGWVEIRPQVGAFVSEITSKSPRKSTFHSVEATRKSSSFSIRKSFILDSPTQKSRCRYQFTDGEPDYRLIKAEELGRFYSSALKRKNVLKRISEARIEGNSFFYEHLSYYINLTEGFRIAKNQLMSAASKELLLYITTQLLVQSGDIILVEAYGYPFSNMVFQQAGARVKTVPMDDEGLDVNYIRTHFSAKEIKCLYLCPQHHYPTTVCLSAQRRAALLQLAQEYDFILIEDYTAEEISFEKSVQLPLFKMNSSVKLIHIGAMGQFLSPGFQTFYLLAPAQVIEEANKYLSIFGRRDSVKEQAIGEMIYEGSIHRYRRKVLKTYKTRRDYFASLLSQHFPQEIEFSLPKGGMAFWLRFKNLLSLPKLAENCLKADLYLPRISMYQDRHLTALRLGFAHFTQEEMDAVIPIFKTAYNQTLESQKKDLGVHLTLGDE